METEQITDNTAAQALQQSILTWQQQIGQLRDQMAHLKKEVKTLRQSLDVYGGVEEDQD
jgi:predicted  nucleic acid-binding Zn-ribbon protein